MRSPSRRGPHRKFALSLSQLRDGRLEVLGIGRLESERLADSRMGEFEGKGVERGARDQGTLAVLVAMPLLLERGEVECLPSP